MSPPKPPGSSWLWTFEGVQCRNVPRLTSPSLGSQLFVFIASGSEKWPNEQCYQGSHSHSQETSGRPQLVPHRLTTTARKPDVQTGMHNKSHVHITVPLNRRTTHTGWLSMLPSQTQIIYLMRMALSLGSSLAGHFSIPKRKSAHFASAFLMTAPYRSKFPRLQTIKLASFMSHISLYKGSQTLHVSLVYSCYRNCNLNDNLLFYPIV